MTLYTQVSSNRKKTVLFMALYVVLILALGYAVSYYFNSPILFVIAAVITVVQGLLSFYYSDKIALTVSHAEPLSAEAAPGLYKIIENLTISAGLPMPRVYIMTDPAMNAFATGRNAKLAAVAVTSGLLEKLDDNELAGVLAHELSHIGNEDIRLMSMVMVMAGLISLISDFFLRSLFWGVGDRRRDSEGSGSGYMLLIALVLAVLAPIAGLLIQLAISRRREFLADASGVLLTRYPEGLISALQKIESDGEPVQTASHATAHMYFSNPLPPGFFSTLFSTHPPVAARIAALRKGSGLAD